MQVCSGLEHGVSLRSLLPDGELIGAADVSISGCTCDSRQVRAGDLFVARADSQVDGRALLAEAVERGCAAVLSDQSLNDGLLSGGLTANCSVPYCIVSNARDAYGRICQALAGDPSQHLNLIGVTGTNGKTTTSCLIAGVLTAAGYRTGVLGALGYLDGAQVEEATHTTPPAEQLASLLARMVNNGCSHAVMEVASQALNDSRVAGVRFDAACVTNVSRDHYGDHASFREYRAAKSKLFHHLAGEGFAVINADDPGSSSYLNQLDGPVLTIGIRLPAEITAVPIEASISEQTFLLIAGTDTMPVRTPMIGVHHIYNCLTAAAVGLAYGIDVTTVVRGLESVGHVPGHLERIECGQPFGVFVDGAHTPHAFAGVLKCLRTVTCGRIVCVFGAGGERGRAERLLMGRAVEQGADLAIITHNNPRHEDSQTVIRDILSGFQSPDRAAVVADHVEAIHRALAAARPGDCVLLAGKGHADYQIIGDSGLPHDDRGIARRWLYEHGEVIAMDRNHHRDSEN